jgi:hypothetical protein
LTGSFSIPSGLPAMAQPVSVCHQWSITGHAELLLRPFDGVGVGAFAREEERFQRRQVVVAHQRPARVVALDRAEGGRRGEEALDPCSAITRQKVPASGVPTGLPSNTMVVQPKVSGA